MDDALTLYRALLGAEFDRLPPTVQRIHSRPGLHAYRGEVEVHRGRGRLSRLCARATRLPPPGRGPIRVDIDARTDVEHWTRHVAGHAMRSRLSAHAGRLRERLGLVTFDFRLTRVADGLCWRVDAVHALGLPLPARWFDAVRAREFEQDGRYRFDVEARLPVAGLLVHYAGWLDVG